MAEIEDRLEHFAVVNDFLGKGPLSVALVLTRMARESAFPLDEDQFITQKGGQVRGLSKGAVQKILKEYDIVRILAEEAGRTSRGSLERMRSYVRFLNTLFSDDILDLEFVEQWWINKILNYFASQPIKLRSDQARSLTSILREVIEAAFERQKECPGTKIAGAVMQHLVGAKLQLALKCIEIEHNGFSVADAPGGRKGDFLIEDTVIHVTTAPTESLIQKCATNLAANLRPVIITTDTGVSGAQALAKAADLTDRIDVLDIAQFISTNVFEWTGFSHQKRQLTISQLIETYNEIIDTCETDPSLKLAME